MVKSRFHKQFQPKHQKCGKVLINPQKRIDFEIKKLLIEEHLEKLNNCSGQFLMSTIVITVKRDQNIKLALDSIILNTSMHKTKYQIHNSDKLIDYLSQLITKYRSESSEIVFLQCSQILIQSIKSSSRYCKTLSLQ